MIKRLFKQFSFYNALRFSFLEFIRRLISPYSFLTYSQTGEDVIIRTMLQKIEKGFYVEIGSNAPIQHSNTFGLYQKGWYGITVDANEKMVNMHKKMRPRDIAICAAVSDEEKEVTFYEFEMNEISTIDEEFYEYAKNNQVVKETIMHTRRLDSIIDEVFKKRPTSIDLLSIDVEGHDYHVLCSLNLKTYRPKLIVIEMHNFDMLNPLSNAIYAHLSAHNYTLMSYAVWNGYFLAN